MVYDVNVYAMDFMHGSDVVEGDHREVNHEGARLGHETGGIEEAEKVAMDRANQEGWALCKVRIYMNGAEWLSYQKELLASCPDDKKAELLGQFLDATQKYDSYRQTLKTEMGRGVDHALESSNSATHSGYEQIQQQARSAAGDTGDHENVAIASSNRIYEDKLEELTLMRASLEVNVGMYHSLVDGDGVAISGKHAGAADTLRERIDAQLLAIRQLVSECSLYSNEAYITDGGVNHTVVGLQKGKNIQQTKADTMNAVNENMADVLKEIGRHGSTIGEAAFKSGKYIWRMGDAAGSVVDLRGADLRGLNLSNMGIFPWDLSGADLRGASFEPPFIARCRLEGARIDSPTKALAVILELWSGRVAASSTVSEARLDGLDLSGLDLGALTLERCSLRGAKLDRARFESLNLSQSDLDGAGMTELQGGELNLEHTHLSGSRLDGCTLSSLRLDRAVGLSSSWVGVRVDQVVARGAKLPKADFGKSSWKTGAFAACELPGLMDQGADFGQVLGLS